MACFHPADRGEAVRTVRWWPPGFPRVALDVYRRTVKTKINGFQISCLSRKTFAVRGAFNVRVKLRNLFNIGRGARMEWRLHCTVERQASRMHEMMDRLDVDAAALVRQKNGEVYAEARSRCLLCQESVRCLRWLDGKSGGGPDFCPVLHFFDACRRAHSAAA